MRKLGFYVLAAALLGVSLGAVGGLNAQGAG
jgi:hypothetical protein